MVHPQPAEILATVFFGLAILHTFSVKRFAHWAHQARPGSIRQTLLHFLAETEVIFGIWAAVLFVGISILNGSVRNAVSYVEGLNFNEPKFVFVVMVMAATRPVVRCAESVILLAAKLIPARASVSFYAAALTLGPLLGSFITEPAAMTLLALLLKKRYFDRGISPKLAYATLGLLFVNVSIGGTLTHFAAPPVLMVARPWGWDTPFMLGHFGWRSALAIAVSTALYYSVFRGEMAGLAGRTPSPDVDKPEDEGPDSAAEALLPVPLWLTALHVAFMGWTVLNSHYPALFLSGFLIFIGLAKATAIYQSRIELKAPLLVGFFLGGLVVHGGLQGWWIAPTLASLSEEPLFLGATLLTAFNDNALITYLATLVPDFSESLKVAVVEGAVTGGGLTVIANAPNPAGQSLLSRFFDGAVLPGGLLVGALLPTIVAMIAFRLI
jgi:hypothetical protein